MLVVIEKCRVDFKFLDKIKSPDVQDIGQIDFRVRGVIDFRQRI